MSGRIHDGRGAERKGAFAHRNRERNAEKVREIVAGAEAETTRACHRRLMTGLFGEFRISRSRRCIDASQSLWAKVSY